MVIHIIDYDIGPLVITFQHLIRISVERLAGGIGRICDVFARMMPVRIDEKAFSTVCHSIKALVNTIVLEECRRVGPSYVKTERIRIRPVLGMAVDTSGIHHSGVQQLPLAEV